MNNEPTPSKGDRGVDGFSAASMSTPPGLRLQLPGRKQKIGYLPMPNPWRAIIKLILR